MELDAISMITNTVMNVSDERSSDLLGLMDEDARISHGLTSLSIAKKSKITIVIVSSFECFRDNPTVRE